MAARIARLLKSLLLLASRELRQAGSASWELLVQLVRSVYCFVLVKHKCMKIRDQMQLVTSTPEWEDLCR